MRLFLLLLILLPAILFSGCAERDGNQDSIYNTSFSFSSQIDENGVPIDSIKRVPLSIKTFYPVVHYFDLTPDVYIFGIRITDGEGNIVLEQRGSIEERGDHDANLAAGIHFQDGIVTLTKNLSRFSIVYTVEVDEAVNKPGYWLFEYFANEDKSETMVEVIRQQVEQDLPAPEQATTGTDETEPTE
ncbi:MAG: hypothetical protein HQM12_05840 [SAR324 cluster bacterium]|nr:hypothetical protein [SAR324 cluster bacterium]